MVKLLIISIKIFKTKFAKSLKNEALKQSDSYLACSIKSKVKTQNR